MKSRMVVTLVVVCIGLLFQAGLAAAAGFSETLKDKLVCSSGSTCTVERTGKFKATAVAFEGRNLDPSEFDESTPIEFEAGDLSFDGFLGDDPKYVAGDSSATFLITHVDPDTGKTVTDVKISLKQGSGGMKIVASGKISDFQPPLLAGSFAGTTGPISTNVTASITLGTNTDSVSGTVIGTASVKSVAKNGETNDLSTVKIKSAKAP
jgi:hypothetical protein